MFYWPPFKADPRAMDVPELDGLPPKLARRIGDKCTFRAYFSLPYAGAIAACVAYFVLMGPVIEFLDGISPALEIAVWPFAFVGWVLGAPRLCRRVQMCQYRREVRACLDSHEFSLQ